MDVMERIGLSDMEGGQQNGTVGFRHYAQSVGTALEGSRTDRANATVDQTLYTASVAALIGILGTAVDVESLAKGGSTNQSVLLLTFFF